MKSIIRVDTRARRIVATEASREELHWGGRSLIAHFLLREVPPACEPTGRRNKLIFASGLLADTGVTTAGQLSIGGKSPLTGGVKESNVGGYAGRRLARLGIRALILEDTPLSPTTDVLVITAQGARLEPAPELAGKLVDETVAALRAKYGSTVGIFCTGPAGEMVMYGAGIACPDNNDVQIRYAARGG
ncbi:MAG: aldehyde ferredoxin oxidoreductase N-terminal domain-containing protein, partial [Spirochaetia bacterium]